MKNTKLQNEVTDEFYRKLEEILKAENRSLSLLKENLECQYQVLLEQKLSDFLKVLEEQKILVWEANQREMIRCQELKRLLSNAENISLKELINEAPDQFRQNLIELKSEFDHSIETIETMKSRNQMLIQKSLEIIQEQIAYLRNFERKSYNASGKFEENKVSSINRQV